MDIYKRFLTVISEVISDNDLDIDLTKAAIETIAEVAASEASDMIEEALDNLKMRITTEMEGHLLRRKGSELGANSGDS